jgi:V/A-type H+/Na+-transporting ATPase subunit A
VAVPIGRQKECFKKIVELVSRDYQFKNQDEVRTYFTRLTGFFKNLNYTQTGTTEYAGILDNINRISAEYCEKKIQ